MPSNLIELLGQVIDQKLYIYRLEDKIWETEDSYYITSLTKEEFQKLIDDMCKDENGKIDYSKFDFSDFEDVIQEADPFYVIMYEDETIILEEKE